MKSDKAKKISLSLSLILALILFFCLYLINLKSENNLNNNDRHQSIKDSSAKANEDTRLIENKSIYKKDKPEELTKVYLKVFETEDEDGHIYNFNDFDLVTKWDTEFTPILNANIQFYSKDIQPKDNQPNYPNSIIKVRGDKGAGLKSYRVKLMDGIKGFQGQSVFNFNKSLNDPSRIANKIAHDLIKDLDNICGFRTNFLEVYIKDGSANEGQSEFISYGLYTHIEQPNKSYLKSRGLDVKGSLYKAEDFYFQPTDLLRNTDDLQYDKQAFETVLGIREGKDHSKLLQMLKDINDESKDFDKVFNTYFDEDNYLTWLSVNIILGNYDAMSKGFLLYNSTSTSVWYLLPWEFNSIFRCMEDDGENPNILDKLTDVTLHRRYLEQEGNANKLMEKIDELMSDSFSSNKIKLLKKNYKPILIEMMNEYPDSVLLNMPLSNYIAYIDQIDQQILLNYRSFIDWYKYQD